MSEEVQRFWRILNAGVRTFGRGGKCCFCVARGETTLKITWRYRGGGLKTQKTLFQSPTKCVRALGEGSRGLFLAVYIPPPLPNIGEP